VCKTGKSGDPAKYVGLNNVLGRGNLGGVFYVARAWVATKPKQDGMRGSTKRHGHPNSISVTEPANPLSKRSKGMAR